MSVFEPTIARTHRRCSTKGCPHAALFFPWLQIYRSATDRKNPFQLECPKQYCPRCREKIKVPDDLGKEWREVMVESEKHFKQKSDHSTAEIFWLPLIVADLNPPQPFSQRLHD